MVGHMVRGNVAAPLLARGAAVPRASSRRLGAARARRLERRLDAPLAGGLLARRSCSPSGLVSAGPLPRWPSAPPLHVGEHVLLLACGDRLLTPTCSTSCRCPRRVHRDRPRRAHALSAMPPARRRRALARRHRPNGAGHRDGRGLDPARRRGARGRAGRRSSRRRTGRSGGRPTVRRRLLPRRRRPLRRPPRSSSSRRPARRTRPRGPRSPAAPSSSRRDAPRATGRPARGSPGGAPIARRRRRGGRRLLPLDRPDAAANPRDIPLRNDQPAYDAADIDALVAYVASLGPGRGSRIATPGRRPRRGADALHGELRGLPPGRRRGAASSPAPWRRRSMQATPAQIVEAVRVGPYLMPAFSEPALPDDRLASVIRYVHRARHPRNAGGWAIGVIGPIPEGLVAWLAGRGRAPAIARLIGAGRPTRRRDPCREHPPPPRRAPRSRASCSCSAAPPACPTPAPSAAPPPPPPLAEERAVTAVAALLLASAAGARVRRRVTSRRGARRSSGATLGLALLAVGRRARPGRRPARAAGPRHPAAPPPGGEPEVEQATVDEAAPGRGHPAAPSPARRRRSRRAASWAPRRSCRAASLGDRPGGAIGSSPWRRGRASSTPTASRSPPPTSPSAPSSRPSRGSGPAELGSPVVVVRIDPAELRLPPGREAVGASRASSPSPRSAPTPGCAIALFRYPRRSPRPRAGRRSSARATTRRSTSRAGRR